MSDAGLSVHDHILVPRAAIPPDQPLAFELYVKVADRFVKVANRGEAIDPERIQRYLNHEKDLLYIDRGSLARFMDEKFAQIFDMIQSPSTPTEAKFEWFSRCLELGYVDLKIVGAHADKFMRINSLIDWSYDHFRRREVRRVFMRQIFKSVQHPLSKRAIFGTCFSLCFILDQSETTPTSFRSFFNGSLYRDISLVFHEERDPHMIPFAEFTPEHREEFEKHPSASVEILRSFNMIDDITRAMIEQHHEQPRGGGFPNGLKRVETFLPAQYLSLADFVVSEHKRFRRGVEKVETGLIHLGSSGLFEFIDHLKKTMAEENQKNLPLILRALHEVLEES